MLSCKDRETLLGWYAGLRFVIGEHRIKRPHLTTLQAKWVRHVFESIDIRSNGFVPSAAIPRVLAAANIGGGGVSIPDSPRVSLLSVQHMLSELLVESHTPVRDLYARFASSPEGLSLDDWKAFCAREQEEDDEAAATAAFDAAIRDTNPPPLSPWPLFYRERCEPSPSPQP